MYNLSQGYAVNSSPPSPSIDHSLSPTICSPIYSTGGSSRLEYIAHSEVSSVPEQVAYRLASKSFSPQSYGPGLVSATPLFAYQRNNHHNSAYQHNPALYQLHTMQPEYHFQPDQFLKPGKEGMFVGKAEEIREHIEQAFETIFQASFPSDLKISVCNQEQFRKLAPHLSTIGLSINRRKQGLLSEIFVLNDSLARVMLTIGHELGHVLTETLDRQHDEEAKAYAFSLAWMKTIKEHDIAGLGDAIVTERPAENGLHNVAFGFVEGMVKAGKRAWDVYRGLIQRRLSVKNLIGVAPALIF